jgi:hypothetical protein
MDLNKYNVYLKMQLPIRFYNVCKINQPTIKDILSCGTDEFERMLFPFCVTVDGIDLGVEITEEEKSKIYSFDILTSSPELFYALCTSLKFFTGLEPNVNEKGVIFDGFDGVLNRYNFDEFAELILKICAKDRPEKEKIPEFQNDRQRDIWEKLQAGRKRAAQRNVLELEDIINICQYGGSYYISKDELLNFTMWELINCYKSKLHVDTYKDNFSAFLQSGSGELIKNHWSDQLKINFKEIEMVKL